MEKRLRQHPVWSCMGIFGLCGAARWMEYFVLRTDGTILAENVLHKLFGIAVLAAALRLLHMGWEDIGLGRSGAAAGVMRGLALGGGCFLVAYGVECLLLYRINGEVRLSLYASGFALRGEAARQDGLLFLGLCLLCNLINVWMEEGLFRGLFTHLLGEGGSPRGNALFIAFLFGVWHWAMPFRDHVDGRLPLAGLLVMGVGYVVLAGAMSLKWSLLYRMTGNLWMGLGDHLFNNVIVTNLLHVVSGNEADSMQVLRVLMGQTLSLAVVAIGYRKRQ